MGGAARRGAARRGAARRSRAYGFVLMVTQSENLMMTNTKAQTHRRRRGCSRKKGRRPRAGPYISQKIHECLDSKRGLGHEDIQDLKVDDCLWMTFISP